METQEAEGYAVHRSGRGLSDEEVMERVDFGRKGESAFRIFEAMIHGRKFWGLTTTEWLT